MSAHALIGTFIGVSALQYLYVFLPGNPFFPDAESAILSGLLQGLLLWLLWRGSAVAWSLLVIMYGLTPVSLVLFSAGGPIEPGLAGLLVLALVSLGLLYARPVRQHVWRPRVPASAASGH